MEDNWFDKASDNFRLRIMFPKFFEESLIELCKGSEESRKKMSDLQKEPNDKFRDDKIDENDIVDQLFEFYQHGGYWGIMADAKKKNRKARERGAMVFETDYGQVNCLKEELLLGKKESTSRRTELMNEYDYKYTKQSIKQMMHAYQILYHMDEERFSMISEMYFELSDYHDTLKRIDTEGIQKIIHEFSSDQDSPTKIIIDTFKDNFETSRYNSESSKYIRGENDEESDEPVVMKGRIHSSRHRSDIYFKVLRINGSYEVRVYNMELSSYIDSNYIMRIIDGYEEDLKPQLEKMVNEFRKTENLNLAIWEKVNSDIAHRNDLEARMKEALAKLKEDNKAIIETYKMSKNMDQVV